MSKTKLFITIAICLLFVSVDHSFANNTDCFTDANTTEKFTIIMDILLRIMGWFRIPFATIAGKLMTNNMIYGEFLNLDKTLYMLRNISRTFANFAVAGIIIWHIIEGITTKDINQNETAKKILKLCIGIGVANMSWFLVGATIDISTILTTAIGGLPGTYFSNDEKSRIKIIESTQISESQKRITLDTTAQLCDLNKILKSDTTTNTSTPESEEELLDKILPQSNSISGPLLYIGSSVIKIQDLMYTNNTSNDISDHLMIILIRLGIVVVFFVAILLIVVVNIFRMVYLWFFIAFAPLLAILWFGNDSASGAESIIDKLLPKFSISNIIKLIFAPVAMTGLLSVLLIVIVLMQQVLQSNNSYVQWGDSITIQQQTTTETNSNKISVSTISSPGIFETTLQGNILSNQVSNVFSDLLMLGITIVLFWGFIKAIIKYNEDGIGGETIKDIGGMAGNLLSNVPILNIGGAKVGLGTARDQAFGRNNGIVNKISNKFGDKSREQEIQVENMINKSLGMPTRLLPSDYKDFTDFGRDLQNSNRILGMSEVDKFMSLSEPIKKHYSEAANNNGQSFSSLSGINDYLPVLLQKIIKNKTNFTSDGFNAKNLDARAEGDNVASYIQRNYNEKIGNKEFIKSLYTKLGGDASVLEKEGKDKVGEMFWNKRIKRSGQKESTTETTTE